MTEYKLTIPGSLPGLNEYSTLERRNRYQAAAMKRQAEHVVMAEIRRQLRGLRIKKPVSMDYLWIEKDRRRESRGAGKRWLEADRPLFGRFRRRREASPR